MLAARLSSLRLRQLFSCQKRLPCFKAIQGGPPPVTLLRLPTALPRALHTSTPRHIHPLVVAAWKPVSRIVALLIGRKMRIWYRKLPEEEKKKFKNKLKKNSDVLTGLGVVLLAVAGALYESHLETCPITNRKRFVALKTDQIETIAAQEFNALLENYDSEILPESHPAYDKVARVANRILQSNKDIEQLYGKNWTVTVVRDQLKNAFVLPGGNIFVFTGMLDVCENDDQLGVVLSHEISHCLLGHVAEKISYVNFVNLLLLLPLCLLWAFLPNDGIALVADWFFKTIMDVVLELPFSRNMETEADEVGLMLAARACFDVREAPVFWGKMALIEKHQSETETLPELISTHPNHESRQQNLTDRLPEALKTRKECNCAGLSLADPADKLKMYEESLNRRIRMKRRELQVNG